MIVLLLTDTDLQCFALDKTFPGWRFAYPGYIFSPNDSFGNKTNKFNTLREETAELRKLAGA